MDFIIHLFAIHVKFDPEVCHWYMYIITMPHCMMRFVILIVSEGLSDLHHPSMIMAY